MSQSRLYLSYALFVPALALMSLGSSSKSSGAPTAAAASSSTPAASTAPAIPGSIVATCNNKSDGKCTETMGVQGFGADESCKRLGGVYAATSTPCPHDNVLGTCARVDTSSGLNDLDYEYKQAGTTEDSMKSLCEGVMSGTWASAPKSAGAPTGKTGAPKAKK